MDEIGNDAVTIRRPGRPKGLPKTGGRQRGTRNHLTADVRVYLLRHGIVERLIRIAKGGRVKVGTPEGATINVTPTLHEQLRALTALLDRAVPALKSAEITGKDGAPLVPEKVVSNIELARRIAFIMNEAVRERDTAGDGAAPVTAAPAGVAPTEAGDDATADAA